MENLENQQQMPLDGFENQLQDSQAMKTSPSRYPDQYKQLQYLMEAGFEWKEATKLLKLKEHFYENSEVRQRLASDPYLCFMRWLYMQGELNEDQ